MVAPDSSMWQVRHAIAQAQKKPREGTCPFPPLAALTADSVGPPNGGTDQTVPYFPLIFYFPLI